MQNLNTGVIQWVAYSIQLPDKFRGGDNSVYVYVIRTSPNMPAVLWKFRENLIEPIVSDLIVRDVGKNRMIANIF